MDGLDKRDNEKEIKRLRHERNFYDKQYQEWAETAELYAKKIDKLRDDNRKLRGKERMIEKTHSCYNCGYECSLIGCDQPESLLPKLFIIAGFLFIFAWTIRENWGGKWKVQK